MTREDVLSTIAIEPGAFVIDVGGGHRPYSRADLIIDKYPHAEEHRVAAQAHAAPVIIADATRLPVPDGGAALVFASHLIEHLPDPAAFIRELQRAAVRAYIEVPALTRELMFAWRFHEWFVAVNGSHLTFYRNDVPQLFGDFFHRGYDYLADPWHLHRHDELNQWYYGPAAALTWSFAAETAFEYAVARAARGADKVNEATPASVPYPLAAIARLTAQRVLPRRLTSLVRRTLRRRREGVPRPLTQALADRLMCLYCRGTGLRLVDDALTCPTCAARYVRRHGLFDLDVLPDPAAAATAAASAAGSDEPARFSN